MTPSAVAITLIVVADIVMPVCPHCDRRSRVPGALSLTCLSVPADQCLALRSRHAHVPCVSHPLAVPFETTYDGLSL